VAVNCTGVLGHARFNVVSAMILYLPVINVTVLVCIIFTYLNLLLLFFSSYWDYVRVLLLMYKYKAAVLLFHSLCVF